MKLKVVWLPGRGISLSTKNFVCCNRNVILACNISRSFADHSSKILSSKVNKFYTGLTMILQKKRRVNFGLKFHFAIRYHRENIWVLQLNIADSDKNIIVYYALRGRNWTFHAECDVSSINQRSTLSYETKV